MQRVVEGAKSPIKMWLDQPEDSAMTQLQNLAALPFIHKHVAVMPDCHAGYGSTVGTVIATKRAVIPAAVGVDIGCGMVAARLNLRAEDLPDSLKTVREYIEAAIPHGRTDNGGKNDRGAWGDPPSDVADAWGGLAMELLEIGVRHPGVLKGNVNTVRHLGSLGTGNHFVEVCLDESGDVWVMLHSGSRGIGNRIGSYFTELAKKDMETWYINVPDVDLAYFPEGTQHFDDYWQAVDWAQRFAMANRTIMLQRAIGAVSAALQRDVATTADAVNCHHNYVARENHFGSNILVTRKGAVRARKGDLGIIPGSMGQRSYIVEGIGNAESFNSCSHGAGRVMSRGAARRKFTVADLEAQTAGVECRKDIDVIDEIPGAYKNIDEVMELQADLVKPLHVLKQVVCVKG
jgi:tRNA-splicing ligase RtcB